MKRRDVLRALAAEERAFRALGVTELHIFGSVARDAAIPTSDIDVFVDHEPGFKFSLFDLVGVKELIEACLRTQADVTTRRGLHPMLRDEIERSAVRVF